ncbi:mitochondrial ribosomal subunit protein-domain-containing protein [Flammula alnicola]|nr:mitochondrial ribosomal subunit protein-domain-containing protein [Flammula alnicola]
MSANAFERHPDFDTEIFHLQGFSVKPREARVDMAHSLARCLAISRMLRASPSAHAPSLKSFSTSSTVLQRRARVAEDMTRRTRSVLEDDMEDLWDQLEEPSDVLDSPSGGHLILQQQRLLLHYLRLIEHEMPKLVAFRKPFVPPTSDTPVIVRSMHYQGEYHPVTGKRVIVVAVDKLPLKNEKAIHKIQLLAGARWTPQPPKDAGISGLDDWGNGFIKISCEDFPKPAQNLKWASDTLDKLIAAANVRKDRKGDHLGSRVFHRPTLRDFPADGYRNQILHELCRRGN